MAPARPRTPSRTVRKRDERVRRVVRKIGKNASWLDAPHFGSLLYAYGALFVRFVDLHGVGAEPVDDLGRPRPPHGVTFESNQAGRYRIALRPLTRVKRMFIALRV
jgi:hypothetical protein